ncbi:MAG: hypothetical protein Q9181_006719 [Wetmoreana brouardii]
MVDPTAPLIENGASFPFLSLPFDIRHHVYEELLVAEPDMVHPLYNDQVGRNTGLCLYPHILRVNKQINTEATSLLYEGNAFMIDLSTSVSVSCVIDPDERGPPQALIRHGSDGSPSWSFKQPGIFYPHVLQRLANVEIFTTPYAVWGQAMGGDFFSHTGELLLEILQILANEEDTGPPRMKKKRLKITISKMWDNYTGGFVLFPRSNGSPWFRNSSNTRTGEKLKAAETCQLIEAIRETREISIIEHKREITYTLPNGIESGPATWQTRDVPLSEFGDL